jgi:hypothetical protein
MTNAHAATATPARVVSRVAASVLGGYAFVWGFVCAGVALLVRAGMPYGEAQTLLYLLAFLAYLVCFCWAIAATSLVRVWGVLVGGAAGMSLLAWGLVRTSG